MVMGFSIICFTAIFALRKLPETLAEVNEQSRHIRWTDRLTDKDSDCEALKPFEREIERFMGKFSVNGMSVAVMRHDSLLYAKGFGWADKEAGIPMTSATRMRIASASKLVTATAIMKLAEQGRLRLDDKVFGAGGILSDTSLTSGPVDRRIFDITVDDLLQHKGGFGLGAGDPMFNTVDIIDAKGLDHAPTPAELIRIVVGRKLAFNPGSGRRYSNFGYFLLSQIIEKVGGADYWDFVNREVLEPAGAYRFVPGTTYYEQKHPEEAKYYGPDTVKVREFNGSGRMVDRVYGGSDINGLSGAGGWVTTPSDLVRLVASIDGNPQVKDILTPESVAMMTFNDGEEKQTRGWSESDGKGKWQRTGTLASTHVLIQTFPNGECWVLATNTGVWTGHHFSHDMYRLVENMRAKYGKSLPRRDLWK